MKRFRNSMAAKKIFAISASTLLLLSVAASTVFAQDLPASGNSTQTSVAAPAASTEHTPVSEASTPASVFPSAPTTSQPADSENDTPTISSSSSHAESLPDSSSETRSTVSSVPASSAPDASISLPQKNGILDGLSGLAQAEPLADPAASVTDYASLNLAVQAIATSGVPGTIFIENSFPFTNTISIAKSADITFVADAATSLTSAASKTHFALTAAALDVTFRFTNVTLDGNNTGGGISTAAPKLSLYNAVLQNIKSAAAVNSTAVSAIVLENCVIQNNTVPSGAVKSTGGSITLTNSKILNNIGRGVAVDAATRPFALTMMSSTVEGNTFTGRSAAGLDIFGSELDINIHASSISKNIATTPSPGGDAIMQGGGLRVTAPNASTSGAITVDITDSAISANEILGGDGGWNPDDWGGAGVFITSRDITPRFTDTKTSAVTLTTNITRTLFAANRQVTGTGYYKSGGSGVAIFTDGDLNMYGSTFDANGGDLTANIGTVFMRVGAKNGTNLHVQNDENGRPTIFENNQSHIAGIYTNYYNYWSDNTNPSVGVLVEDAIFRNNKGNMGMALYISEYYPNNSSVKALKRCSFINNQSAGTYVGASAAIVARFYNYTAYTQELLVEDCVFSGNTGYSKGAGVYFEASSNGLNYTKLTVTGSQFTNNRITGSGALADFGGAGIFITNASGSLAQIANTSFSGNFAPQGRYTALNPFADRCSNILSSTTPFSHPFNNFDINYTGGSLATIYTVLFDSQGGTSVHSTQAMNATSISPPAPPTKANHTFGGWYKEATCLNEWLFASDKVTGDRTLYAKWNVNKYTVQFDSTGGDPVLAIADVVHGSLITEPQTPTLTGHDFAGWYKEEACLNKWDFAQDTVVANTVLYANWTANTYTVQFDSRGGSAVTSLATVPYGSNIAAPLDPVYTGYTFTGWYKESACQNEWNFAQDAVTSPTILYAQWTKNYEPQVSSSSIASSSKPVLASSSSGSSAPVVSSSTPVSSSSASSTVVPPVVSSDPVVIASSTVSSASRSAASIANSSSSSSAPVSSASISSSAPVDSSSGTASSVAAASETSSDGTGGPGGGTQNWEEQNQQALSALKEEGVPTFSLGENEIPLFGGNDFAVWSLLNLMLAIFSIIASGFMLVRQLLEKRRVAQQEGKTSTNTRSFVLKTSAIVCGAALLVVFLLTQNLSALMVFVDSWTILFAGVTILQPVLYVLGRKASTSSAQQLEGK